MIRALPLLLALAACVPATQASRPAFPPGTTEIAAQRMRFAAEAVCLNNATRAAQEKAAGALSFPIRQADGEAVVYVNPGTLTFLRLGRVPERVFRDPDGRGRAISGEGCSVGSPAVATRLANRLAGEILAPRLVDGSDTLLAPLGAGVSRDGGTGYFFDNLTVTLEPAITTIPDPRTGEARMIEHLVIQIVHGRPAFVSPPVT